MLTKVNMLLILTIDLSIFAGCIQISPRQYHWQLVNLEDVVQMVDTYISRYFRGNYL